MIQRLSNQLFDVLRTLFRRGALFLLAVIMSASLTLTPILTPPANAQGLTDLLSLGGSLTNGQSSCSIETVGWVICPTMRSIAKLADYGFSYINQSFLKVDYSLTSTDSGTYTAWGIMRNIANALFVVAFMTLIYSQLTGRGGGYNIKRLIPKLLISAILVNISYYLCVAIIEVTNILGDSIIQILAAKNGGIASLVGTQIMPIGTAAQSGQDGTLTTITASVLGKGGAAWVLLAPVAAVTVSIATICAAGVVLLIMRKTVIAMLILVSPILFVAYLLPNLERYFFQGVRLFAQLLLLYPIIALLLGAGQIVSATIVTVGTGDTGSYRVTNDSYSSRNGGTGSAITDLTAGAAAVLPLLAVWFVFKNMSSIMSTAGARLSASVAGRRGGKDDEKARVTGNATAGAAANKNVGGIGGNRRQAFSRNRRHSSLAGSSLTGEDAGGAGQANRRSGEGAAQNALDASVRGEGAEDAKKQLEELQNARLSAEATTGDVDMNAVGAAVAGAAAPAADKPKTAKDIFNNLNKTHDSKDKDRKFGAGAPAAGSGGGNQAGGAAPQVAPSSSYRAPQIAQSGNIVSGTSTPQQQVKVIAVPVQVDASALLGQNQSQPQTQSHPPDNVSQPPISGTEEKAKARAQQYIFDSERDIEEARNKQDILGHKDAPTEPPHISKDDEKDKE
jgi:hypothetical protein